MTPVVCLNYDRQAVLRPDAAESSIEGLKATPFMMRAGVLAMELENFERPSLLWGPSRVNPNERRLLILEAVGGPPDYFHLLEWDPAENGWQSVEVGAKGDRSYSKFEIDTDQLPEGCTLPERYADLA